MATAVNDHNASQNLYDSGHKLKQNNSQLVQGIPYQSNGIDQMVNGNNNNNNGGRAFMDEEEAEGVYQGPQLFRYDEKRIRDQNGAPIIYVPKQQGIEFMNNLEKQANKRVIRQKEYTKNLRRQFAAYEKDSEKYYQKMLQEYKKLATSTIDEKNSEIAFLKSERERHKARAQYLRNRARDLNGKLIIFFNEDDSAAEEYGSENEESSEEERPAFMQKDALNKSSDSLGREGDRYVVDQAEFDYVKLERKRLKLDLATWTREFNSKNGRMPTQEDQVEVQKDIEELNKQNQRYAELKYVYAKKSEKENEEVQFEGLKKKTAAVPAGLQGNSSFKPTNDPEAFRSTKTGFGFGAAQQNQQPRQTISHGQGLGNSEQARRLKDEMQHHEEREEQLNEEIANVQAIIDDNVEDVKVIEELQEQLERKQTLLQERDQKVESLLKQQEGLAFEKQELLRKLDVMRTESLLQGGSLLEKADKTDDNSFVTESSINKTAEPVKQEQPKPKEEPKVEPVQVEEEKVIEKKTTEPIKVANILDEIKKDDAQMGNKQLSLLEEAQRENNLLQKEILAITMLQREKQQEESVKEKDIHGKNEMAKQIEQTNYKLLALAQEDVAQKNAEISEQKEILQQVKQVNTDLKAQSLKLAPKGGANVSSDEATAKSQALLFNLSDTNSKEVTEMAEVIQRFTKELQDKSGQLTTLEQERDDLTLKMQKDIEGKEKDATDKNASSNDKLREKMDRLTDLQSQIERQSLVGQSANAKLVAEHNKLVETLTTENQSKIKANEKEIAKLKKQIEQHTGVSGDLTGQIKEMEGDLKKIISENDELNKNLATIGAAAEKAAEYKERSETLKKDLKETTTALDTISTKYKEEQQKRKKLLNELEDMKGKVRVYCRIRPFSKTELADQEKAKSCVDIHDDFSLTVSGRLAKQFNFDSVFGGDSTQEAIFEDTQRLIQSALDGYNVCIFAYGQTGSGKTFTVQGTKEMPGITPRSIQEIFTLMEGMENYNVKLKCYMVELYLAQLRDLLKPPARQDDKLEIKESATKMVVIQGVNEVEIHNAQEAIDVFEKGLSSRKVRKTNMNSESSRSHLVFSIIIDSTNISTSVRTIGKISFVDLAGSEKSSKTGTTKEGAAEALAINQSLSALGNVIQALSEGSAHVPYRDHVLTKLMKDSLGGTAKTLMFVNASPSIYNESETKNSLEYATRVKKIKNTVAKNTETKEMQALKGAYDNLDSHLDKILGLLAVSNFREKATALQNEFRKKQEGE